MSDAGAKAFLHTLRNLYFEEAFRALSAELAQAEERGRQAGLEEAAGVVRNYYPKRSAKLNEHTAEKGGADDAGAA